MLPCLLSLAKQFAINSKYLLISIGWGKGSVTLGKLTHCTVSLWEPTGNSGRSEYEEKLKPMHVYEKTFQIQSMQECY